jgi:hypothetical protein
MRRCGNHFRTKHGLFQQAGQKADVLVNRKLEGQQHHQTTGLSMMWAAELAANVKAKRTRRYREKRRKRKQKLEKPSKELRRLRKSLARVRVGESARHIWQ